jgi:hypothetical protein
MMMTTTKGHMTSFNHRRPVLLGLLLLAGLAPAGLQASTLTGITVFGAGANGAMGTMMGIPTVNVWNTTGGDMIYNLYAQDAAGNWLNSGNGANTGLSVGLAHGVYTLTLFGELGLTTQSYIGVNLFFDGSSTPGISAFVPLDGTGSPAANSAGQTAPLSSGYPYAPISGAGSLQYGNVALTGFSWFGPGTAGAAGVPPVGDYVNGFNNSPLLGINDYRGTLTLVAAPEPGSLVFLSSGALLFGLLVLGRRRRSRRSAA